MQCLARFLAGASLLAACAQGSSRGVDNGDAAVPADSPAVPRDIGPLIDATPPLTVDALPPDAMLPIDAMLPPDACVPATVELLQNPSFDLAPIGVNWVAQPVDPSLALITADGFAPDSAPYKAWMGGVTGDDIGAATATDVLYQDVAVPTLTTNLTLTFKYLVGTQEAATATTAFDTGSIAATQTNGTPIVTILALSNTTATGTVWTSKAHTFTQNLSGQTIRLRMTSTNDDIFATNFFFDSMSLKATHGCP